MGQTYYQMNDMPAAQKILSEALEDIDEEDPFYSDILYFLACIYEVTGSLEAALKNWKKIPHISHRYDSAKEKVDFYETVLNNDIIKNFFTEGFEAFELVSEALLSAMDYIILTVYHKDAKTLQYVCNNRNDSYLFNKHFVTITRNTFLIDSKFIQSLESAQTNNRCQFLAIVAPAYHQDSYEYVKGKNISLLTLDVFVKYKLFS